MTFKIFSNGVVCKIVSLAFCYQYSLLQWGYLMLHVIIGVQVGFLCPSFDNYSNYIRLVIAFDVKFKGVYCNNLSHKNSIMPPSIYI